MPCKIWKTFRLIANDLFSFIYKNFMFCVIAFNECTLPCTFVDHLTILIKEPHPCQLCTIVVQVDCSDCASNSLARQSIRSFNLQLTRLKHWDEFIVIRSVPHSNELIINKSIRLILPDLIFCNLVVRLS